MFELTINGTNCPFNFGMGFLREMNKKVSIPVEGMKGVTQNVGFKFIMARLIDGDVEAMVDVLDLANKGCNPRLTKAAIEAFIEDEETDIDEVFETVMGFLKTANATKKAAVDVLDLAEKEKAKQEALEKARLEAMN